MRSTGEEEKISAPGTSHDHGSGASMFGKDNVTSGCDSSISPGSSKCALGSQALQLDDADELQSLDDRLRALVKAFANALDARDDGQVMTIKL